MVKLKNVSYCVIFLEELSRTFKSKLHSDMFGNDRAMCFLSVLSHGGVIMIR